MVSFAERVSHNVARIRLRKHLSIQECADKANLEYKAWWRVETGRRPGATHKVFEQMAAVLNVDISTLVTSYDETPEDPAG